jgi:glyoxylase-like metal-dependent hydrolase (beta-lactamase superfamily II)
VKLADGLYSYVWTNSTVNNCNTFVLECGRTVLIDPGLGSYVDDLFDRMKRDRLDPEAIDVVIATHIHPDHFEGVARFANGSVKMGLHAADEKFLGQYGREFFMMFGLQVPDCRVDFYLEEGELVLGDATFQVYHTPGHSPGSISLYWREKKALVTGDVIFAGSVGRTDFPGGDGETLKESIGRLSELDVEYLLPGHGVVVKGKDTIKKNFESVENAYFDFL